MGDELRDKKFDQLEDELFSIIYNIGAFVKDYRYGIFKKKSFNNLKELGIKLK